jgi:aminoglycoside phosphotransferase (APT) family kinase protein
MQPRARRSPVSEWTPELEVDPTLAAALIAQLGVAVDRIEHFGTGWDNVAYLVNGELVFRFPQRTVAARIMENELRALPSLAPRLPLSIPSPIHVGGPSERYPWRFAGYPLVRGVTACRTDLPAIAPSFVEPLARFLAALHAIGGDDIAEPDRFRKLDLAIAKERIAARLDDAAHEGWLDGTGGLRALLEPSPVTTPDRVCVCHGDLYARHLLVDQPRLAGVIDWGDVHRGDPAVDLSIAWMLFGPPERARFWSAYGVATPREIALARLRALSHSLGTLVYALEIGDRDLERACRFALDNLRD